MKGAIAGAVATFVMDRATTFLYQREDRRAREREDEARGGTTAYESVAEKGAALVGTRLTRAERERGGSAIHWALGIGAGAAYAVLRRRLALVGVIPINRGRTGVTVPDLTQALIDRVKTEREDLMVKAVSWALRELTKTHPDRVAAYVEANRDTLAALVIREVGNKLRTGLKSGRVKA